MMGWAIRQHTSDPTLDSEATWKEIRSGPEDSSAEVWTGLEAKTRIDLAGVEKYVRLFIAAINDVLGRHAITGNRIMIRCIIVIMSGIGRMANITRVLIYNRTGAKWVIVPNMCCLPV